MRLKIFILLIILSSLGGLGLPAEAAFEKDLYFGLRNDPAVAELQEFLLQTGTYAGPVTGNFFSLTLAGVKIFQRQEGIAPAAGYFGPLTRARANQLVAAPAAAARRAELQAQINQLLQQLAELQARWAEIADLPPEQPVDARSVVGLNCFFRYLPTGEVVNITKASGVIVGPSGVILTARHLVDLRYSYQIDADSIDRQLALNTSFDHCEVGQLPAGTSLPDVATIRAVNPAAQIPFLGYTARLLYAPSSSNLILSESEADALDFALLKINGVSEAGSTFGLLGLPPSFETADLLTERTPELGAEVVTYGYPADVTTGRKSSFSTLYMVGSVGRIKQIRTGNLHFSHTPLVVNTDLEVRGGRSGSPLFWRGYVIGIVSAHAVDNAADSYSVSIEAIYPLIRQLL